MKTVRPINVCLNETYSSRQVGNHMSDMFSIKNGLQQADALSPLVSIFVIENSIRRVQANQEGLKLTGMNQLLMNAGDVKIVSGITYIIKKNT